MLPRTIVGAAVLAVLAVGARAKARESSGATPRAAALTVGTCEGGCDEQGCWVLVYRYAVNLADPGRRPILETRETFDDQNFPTEEAAYCGARRARLFGVELPTLVRFGRDSNVAPESITPMPALLALELGIPGPTAGSPR